MIRLHKISLWIVVSLCLTSLIACKGLNTQALRAPDLSTSSLQQSTSTVQQAAKDVGETVSTVSEALEEFTPEQEYYLGRAVAASILGQYRPYENKEHNRYINLLGQTLAQFSDNPVTFGGYHFLILDTDEVNAFAAPGGFIFITRGLLRCCRSEDAVASVLAHEIGHVQKKHGMGAIKTQRLTKTLGVLAKKVNYTSAEIAQLTGLLEESVGDIVSTMVNSGYSRGCEREADADAVAITRRIGYNPWALVMMLEEMKQYYQEGGLGFGKTHPSPGDRIDSVQPRLGEQPTEVSTPARQARFDKMLGETR